MRRFRVAVRLLPTAGNVNDIVGAGELLKDLQDSGELSAGGQMVRRQLVLERAEAAQGGAMRRFRVAGEVAADRLGTLATSLWRR
ncbi:MAG: hypothetical protein LBF42_01180 [Puniceicoccales bacterium]|jgi:hypothetical protein|nr:hypothetical protein [Puniceicoccales bacterium]